MTPPTPPATRRAARATAGARPRGSLPLRAAAAPVAVLGLLGLVGATTAAFRDTVELPVEGLDGTFEVSQPVGADCTDRVAASTAEEAHLVLDRASAANIRRVPVPLTGIPTQAAATFQVTVCHAAAVTGELALTLADRTEGATPFTSLVFAVAVDGQVLTGPVPMDAAAIAALNDGRGVLLPPGDGGGTAPTDARTVEVRAWMLKSAPTEHALLPVDIGVQVVGQSRAGAPVVLEGVLP
ncbi:hypothetical protein [Cellulomonas sp. PS-H5]|uniref:hypothetical protein n=1 Tax=Cellulomonas sp. PS-H5 TaxID=2820400 RepID=UPI001C4F55F5|nr:hypothetical protein [Cellulomonas sp. PS-H5]MBW0252646.1 hypothetical protein [Cellulomonas sp. PS-H5]